MPKTIRDPAILNPAAGTAEGITGVRRQEASLELAETGLDGAVMPGSL